MVIGQALSYLNLTQQNVQGLYEVHVEHRAAVTLLPSATLPLRHPLGGRVDKQLGVRAECETLEAVVHRLTNRDDGAQELASIVGGSAVDGRAHVIGMAVSPEHSVASLKRFLRSLASTKSLP